jgi:O-acetyl-ADP-ribose deacetylase (regulator of RNase III)
MITYRTGDLLEQTDIIAIVHQTNLYHTFGAGIAKAIKHKFPYAYGADLATILGDENKLGNFSIGYPSVASNDPFVFNLYSQEGIGPSHTNYNFMYEGLRKVARHLQGFGTIKSVGFPYMIGCGLADGNWEIVKVIIEQAFEGSDIEVVIVKLPEV